MENNSQEVKQLVAAVGIKLSAADEVYYLKYTNFHRLLTEINSSLYVYNN
jgi:hypothetical protein